MATGSTFQSDVLYGTRVISELLYDKATVSIFKMLGTRGNVVEIFHFPFSVD